jgi:hypothetical protein
MHLLPLSLINHGSSTSLLTFTMTLLLLVNNNDNRNGVQAFYLPGMAPRTYQQGEQVELKVNRLTSA